jgi:hypothetical protein
MNLKKTFGNNFIFIIALCILSDFIMNTMLRDKINQEFVSNIVRKRRWKYLGHVLRSDKKRLNRQVLVVTRREKKKENVEDLNPHFEEQSYKKVLRWDVTPYKISNY